MVDLLDALGASFGPVLLIAAWIFAFAESALGLGAFVPGELGVLTLGAAVTDFSELAWVVGVAAIGASAGDHVGYLLGRSQGHRLRDTRLIRRIGVHQWDNAATIVRRRGALVVLASRLLPGIRTLAPAAAGASGLPYGAFLAASGIGSLLWAAAWGGIGAGARSSLPEIAATVGRAGWLITAVVVGAVVLSIVLTRRRRPRPDPVPAAPAEGLRQPAEARSVRSLRP